MQSNEAARCGTPDSAEKRGPIPLVAEHLFASRTVLIFGEIDARLAESVTAQLLALAARGRDPIQVVINSPGGLAASPPSAMAGEPAPAGCEPFDDEPQATGSANAQQSAATRTAALRRRIESDDSVT